MGAPAVPPLPSECNKSIKCPILAFPSPPAQPGKMLTWEQEEPEFVVHGGPHLCAQWVHEHNVDVSAPIPLSFRTTPDRPPALGSSTSQRAIGGAHSMGHGCPCPMGTRPMSMVSCLSSPFFFLRTPPPSPGSLAAEERIRSMGPAPGPCPLVHGATSDAHSNARA